MNHRIRIAFAVLWLCCSSALSAQIGFSLPLVNMAVPGTDKNLAVKVTNFDSIVSMQYVIRWNPSVLKFVTINNFGAIPGLSLSNFNTVNALDSGMVRLQWEGPVIGGITLADETTIFRLRYTIIGPDTSSSSIKFTEITSGFPTTEFEIVTVHADSSNTIYHEEQCALTHGFVAVGYTVDTKEPGADDFGLSVFPNPFSETTKATFNLEQTADIQAIVTDLTGRILFTRDMPKLPPGKHGIVLEKDMFPAKGAYFLTLRAGSETSVRKIVCN